MKIKLGSRYRDKVSGWEGTAVARYEYMNGCIRYELAAHDKDGKPEAFVFDQQQLEAVKELPIKIEPRKTGGNQSSAPVQR